MSKNNIAFTLVEMLIVIGLIGTISALVVTNLSRNYSNKTTVTKVRKVNYYLNEAFGSAIAKYGPVRNWYTISDSTNNRTLKIGKKMTEFLDVELDCGLSANLGCFSSRKLKRLNGNDDSQGVIDASTARVKYLLKDNISLAINVTSANCSIDNSDGSQNSPYKNVCFDITVDIDGPGDNTYNTNGKDIFQFFASNDGIFGKGGKTFSVALFPAMATNGYNTAAWVIENGNMDYLNADSTGKCKNSNVTLSWTATSCK